MIAGARNSISLLAEPVHMHLSELITLVAVAVILYVHLGYPLLTRLLCSWFGKPLRRGHFPTRLSLILPVYNEAQVVRKRIENLHLARNGQETAEILVVDDGSDDATVEIVRSLDIPDLRLLEQPVRQGKGAALNRAVREARGDILILTDAHARFDNRTIPNLLRNLADPAVGAVTGTNTVDTHGIGAGEQIYWQFEAWVKRNESRLHSTCAVTGAIVAIRKPLFRDIPKGLINDDAYLNLDVIRQGYRFVCDSEAHCIRSPSVSHAEDRIRHRRIVAGRYQLLLRPALWPWNNPMMLFCYWSHKFLRLALGPLMLIALLANLWAVTVGSSGWLSVLLGLQLGFYLLVGVSMLGIPVGRFSIFPKAAHFLFNVSFSALQALPGPWRQPQGSQWQKARKAGEND